MTTTGYKTAKTNVLHLIETNSFASFVPSKYLISILINIDTQRLA